MRSITLRGVSKSFEKVPALLEVNLEIRAGERLVLIGGSGAGKTTLLRVLAGLETPDQGAIYCDDTDITRTPAHQRGIGMLSQDYAIYPHLSVEQNLLAALEPLRLSARDRSERIEEALSWFELRPLRLRRPAQLSGGQLQRVAIAKALVRRPRMLVLDEPLSQLDPALREQSRELILSLTQQFGTTLVMVTHDSLEALRLADRLAVLESGKLVQIDSPQTVYRRPNSRSIAEILSPFGLNDAGQACFRPESGRIIAAPNQCEQTDLCFEGVIQQLQFLGFASLAWVEVAQAGTRQGIRILVTDRTLRVGEVIFVRVARKDVLPMGVGIA